MKSALVAIERFFALLEAFHPLDDFVYPFFLDHFGHTVASRVCGALLALGVLTVLPVYFVFVWAYNTLLDLLNVAGGLYAAGHEAVDRLRAVDEDFE